MPIIRTTPEDFIVHEQTSTRIFDDDPTSPALAVHVEKRGWTTEEVVGALAELVAVRIEDIGYAGRKDRHALTRQWFSVPRCELDRLSDLEQPDLRLLEVRPLARKMRLGDLEGNHFSIVVRGVTPEYVEPARERWQAMVEHGMPNRFGSQRFGARGDNADRGALIVRGDLTVKNRRLERLMVSAFQSTVFNRVLERRDIPLSTLRDGDLAWVHKRGVAILVRDPNEDQEQADRFEISPTGPLFGERMKLPRGEPLAEEEAVLGEFDLPTFRQLSLPRRLRLPGARRALRVRISDGVFDAREDRLELQFGLPPGSYATILLEELFPTGSLVDASRPERDDEEQPEGSVDGVG